MHVIALLIRGAVIQAGYAHLLWTLHIISNTLHAIVVIYTSMTPTMFRFEFRLYFSLFVCLFVYLFHKITDTLFNFPAHPNGLLVRGDGFLCADIRPAVHPPHDNQQPQGSDYGCSWLPDEDSQKYVTQRVSAMFYMQYWCRIDEATRELLCTDEISEMGGRAD